MRKVLLGVLALCLVIAVAAPAISAEKPYIAMISKGFQHQFWQTVKSGADDAAKKYDVNMTFDGPASESEVSVQIDMLNAALAKNPAALCLAALDTDSVTEQLRAAKGKNIPVIGFDSGVPNAPEGTIQSTASTNNEAAGALAAERMFNIAEVKKAIEAATPAKPILISAFSQDATSASVVGRTVGFINKMLELCLKVKPGAVAITGHDRYVKKADGPVAIEISVAVPASTNVADCQTTAQGILARANLVSIFCSNSGSMDGVLSATADGSELDKKNGKFKDLVVVGFDAGATLKNAIKNKWVYGGITQDPYMIGFYAVELAVKALKGEKVEPLIDTGCHFYTSENMNDPKIAPLLYD